MQTGLLEFGAAKFITYSDSEYLSFINYIISIVF